MIWTTQQDAALLILHRDGKSAAEIADLVGVAQRDVQQRLMWLLLPKPHAMSA